MTAKRVLVVGAGIVGCALAAAGRVEVTVLETSAEGQLVGSTGYAPGFIGLYNDAPVLVALAQASAAVYDAYPSAFRRVGGTEVGTSTTGADELERRAYGASDAGLAVKAISGELAAQLAPGVVDPDRVLAAWSYPHDGVADTRVLTAAIRADAARGGAQFHDGSTVTGLDYTRGRFTAITQTGERHLADELVLAGGVWGPTLARLLQIELPLVPVAHPYVYSAAGKDVRRGSFVRWPEHHVYARAHQGRIGIGSYAHTPIPVTQDELASGASLPWPATVFDPVITAAQQLLPPDTRFDPGERINGVFAVTPDNLPLLGPLAALPGLWSAQAIWVTHAAGAAQALAAAITTGRELPQQLDPARFAATPAAELQRSALRLYHDIYANDAATT